MLCFPLSKNLYYLEPKEQENFSKKLNYAGGKNWKEK